MKPVLKLLYEQYAFSEEMRMKWKKYTIETTTAAEDFISSMLSDLEIEGVEIEDKVPLSQADTAKMFIDFLPELPPDDGISFVTFYLDAGEDHTEKLKQVREGLEELRLFVEVGSGEITESETEDLDWVNNWKEFFHAFTIENAVADPEGGAGRKGYSDQTHLGGTGSCGRGQDSDRDRSGNFLWNREA